MWALERRQNKASSHLVLFRAATAVRTARRRHSRHVRQGQHRRKHKAFCFWNVVPPESRFYKGGIGKKCVPFLCVCACIFSSKKDAKIRVPANKTNPTTCMHSYQTKRGGAYYTSRSKTRPPSLANIHPSIHRTTTHYYYYRIETPTTIAAVKRSRERDNLLIVQRRRERKNFEEKKKRGKFCPPHN